MWTEPKGERSFYRVQWTNGSSEQSVIAHETKMNVTGLTAGVKYSFTVISVAGDNKTESDTAEIFHYTSKMMNIVFVDPGASETLFCV